jgi:cytochrome c oxidase subunit 2
LKARGGNPDVVINVEAMQYTWIIRYPEHDITTNKIVLPVGKRTKFDISSWDVLHSFWIPVFRAKIDAVPGQTTRLYVNPTKLGSYDEDKDFRVQCAELCGEFHNQMRIPVEVVSVGDYENWIDKMTSNKQ